MKFTLFFLYPMLSFSIVMQSPKSKSYYVDNWENFHNKVTKNINEHPIIKQNNYTNNFAKGEASLIEQQVLTQQFSVFTQWFLVSQLLKIINTPDIYEMQIQNEKFNFRSSRFEKFLEFAKKLDLSYEELGKRDYASLYTLYFCDELNRLYGSDDTTISIASTYAFEIWIQTNFWDELIEGFEKINENRKSAGEDNLPLFFWTYNSRMEKQNGIHTIHDLKRLYVNGHIEDEEKFIYISLRLLDAIDVFWSNLNKTELCKSS